MKRYVKCSESAEVFQNFGDVNFLDGGCILADVSSDYNPGTYHIIRCDFVWDMGDDPAHYELSDVILDINDNWIDTVAVEQWGGDGIGAKESNPEWFAVDCVSYYGAENCGGQTEMLTAQEVEDYVKSYNIPSDIYFSGE